jgi:hypothetical protein
MIKALCEVDDHEVGREKDHFQNAFELACPKGPGAKISLERSDELLFIQQVGCRLAWENTVTMFQLALAKDVLHRCEQVVVGLGEPETSLVWIHLNDKKGRLLKAEGLFSEAEPFSRWALEVSESRFLL